MKLTLFIFTLSIVFAPLTPRPIFAGPLDDAPFRIVVPNSEWRRGNSTVQLMGGDVSVAAIISNTNKMLKSAVIKAVLKEPLPSSLDNLCAGMRDIYTNSPVKMISVVDTTFLGFKARALTFQITKGKETLHNEMMVFVADHSGWMIVCSGRLDQKEEIKKMFDFYEKKAG